MKFFNFKIFQFSFKVSSFIWTPVSLQNAYSILTDDCRRKTYDTWLHSPFPVSFEEFLKNKDTFQMVIFFSRIFLGFPGFFELKLDFLCSRFFFWIFLFFSSQPTGLFQKLNPRFLWKILENWKKMKKKWGLVGQKAIDISRRWRRRSGVISCDKRWITWKTVSKNFEIFLLFD